MRKHPQAWPLTQRMVVKGYLIQLYHGVTTAKSHGKWSCQNNLLSPWLLLGRAYTNTSSTSQCFLYIHSDIRPAQPWQKRLRVTSLTVAFPVCNCVGFHYYCRPFYMWFIGSGICIKTYGGHNMTKCVSSHVIYSGGDFSRRSFFSEW